MPKLYRDAATGQYTTAEDAAARPAETVAETVEARHETPDVAELRRLYEAAMCVDANEMAWDEWTTAISEAADALLDEADRLAHMTEARDNARVEVERLTALLADVRAAVLGEDSEEWTRMAGTSHMIAASYLLRILDGRADS